MDAKAWTMQVSISPGDYCDRVSILQVRVEKVSRQQGAEAAQFAEQQLQALSSAGSWPPALAGWIEVLRRSNAVQWDLEDRVRQARLSLDAAGEDPPRALLEDFVFLTRKIQEMNALRSRLREQINSLFGVQEPPKQYHGESPN